MLREWKVVRYLDHLFRQHFFAMKWVFRWLLPGSTSKTRLPSRQNRVFSLKIANGFPCHPGCDTAPAQSIHMDLGVRMDGYGPPPPFILTSRGKLPKSGWWSSFTGHQPLSFVMATIAIKNNLSKFSWFYEAAPTQYRLAISGTTTFSRPSA